MTTQRPRPRASSAAALIPLLASLAFFAPPTLHAQSVAPAPAPVPAPTASAAASTKIPKDDDVVLELSPFEVRSEKDVGYQSVNTTSGSRLNTALKDTAAQISPFTKEFLDDVGATSLNDLMAYSANIEPEMEELGGFNNAGFAANADTNVTSFRMRGQVGGFSLDLADSGAPVDLSDVERAEVASGPNSILFGSGAPGGIIGLTTKRANLQRASGSAKFTFGSWDLRRGELDVNRPLLKGKLGLRVWGLWMDREGWRHYDFEDTRRLNAAITARPFKNTTLSLSGGIGDQARHVTSPWNGGDAISLWRQNGMPVAQNNVNLGVVTNAANTNRYTFFQEDNAVINVINTFVSRGAFRNGTAITANTANDRLLLTPDLMPFNTSTTGPGARFTSKFNNYIVRLEQKVGPDLNFELGFQHSEARNTSTTVNAGLTTNMLDLSGDANLTYRALDGSTLTNARARSLYMETNWRPETAMITNDVFRATASYNLDLGTRWGLHRFAGLFEHSLYERERKTYAEVLASAAGVPIANAATPEAAVNEIVRRHYVTEGQFTSYYAGDPRLAIPTVNLNGVAYGRRLVGLNQGALAFGDKTDDAAMLALQSYWLNKKVVTTFGYRRDELVYRRATAQRLATTDPLVTSGAQLANEWFIKPDAPLARNTFETTTRTLGAVWHAHPRFSFFYNQSSNLGAPRFDRTVLSTATPTVIPGVLPPAPSGEGKDYGVMIDLFKDGRFHLRVNRFTSDQLADAAGVPNGVNNITDNFFITPVHNILNDLLARNRITRTEFDAYNVGFSSFMVDTASTGTEVELVANLTRNWTMRLSGSYTDRFRTNYFAEREPYFGRFTAFVKSKDDGVAGTGGTITQQLDSMTKATQDAIDSNEGNNTGARPYKFNYTSRYRFTESRLKGLAVGASYIWQDRALMQRAGQNRLYSTSVHQTNFFANYDWRTPWQKQTVKLQLNVNNAFNETVVTTARFNTGLNGVRRVYLRSPREVRLSATLPF